MSCIGHDITLVSQPGQIVLTDHPELYMNLKNDFLWQMPWRHVLFLCPRRGLPEMGSRDGVRHLCYRWGQALCQIRGQALCPRWGQAPLPDTGSGTLPEMGSDPFARDGVRHLCPRWGQAPLSEVGSDPIGDCDISALALYSALFYNSWCW